MSYTPTTWTTGDTITASALNKIEQGIADAGGGGVASVRISATGFASASMEFGYIVYAYRDNGNWIVSNDNSTVWHTLYGVAKPEDRLVNVTISSDSDVAVFLLDKMKGSKNVTGGVSSTSEYVYMSYGSSINCNGYRITGNGSFEFVAD